MLLSYENSFLLYEERFSKEKSIDVIDNVFNHESVEKSRCWLINKTRQHYYH